MKILAIQDYLRMGGTEAQFLDLTARWSAAGHEVKRLVFRRRGELLPAARENGPEPEFLQPFPTSLNWWAPGLRRAVKNFGPDRVICFGRNAHWSLARHLRQERVPGLVGTLRTGRPLPKGYRRLLQSAEAVVANSEFAGKLGVGQGVAHERLHVIENGCRLAGLTLPDRGVSRAELQVAEDRRVLLCLGSFVPGKCQERLLGIWAKLDSSVRAKLELWFVGDGPRKETVAASAKDLPDSDRIRFWGNRSDPGKWILAADAMISVSREESSPNALVEGLWAGVPIAATRCAGVEEIVSEKAGGFLAEDSEEGEVSLSRWIALLPEEGGARKALAESWAHEARRRFDPEERSKDYLRLFDEISWFSSL